MKQQHEAKLCSFLVFTTVILMSFSILGNEVVSSEGVVVSRSKLASDAGLSVLLKGGNAVDAAVATAFTLAVVHPAAGNLGGGGFMVIRFNDGTVITNDHREVAPLAASRDMFLDEEGNYDSQKSLRSHHASGIPGSVRGLLDAHERYGKLPRDEVISQAIHLAKDGFSLPADLVSAFASRKELWERNKGSREKFLKEDGSTYEEGELFVQPDLARTLERIRDLGYDGFYKGETADLIVEEMKRGGGLITHEDLEQYRSVWRAPIHGTYKGFEVFSMPPPSSGGVLLIQLLNMLEPYDIGELGFGTPATIHLMAEAERRAYADRAQHLGDMDFYPVPIETLTNKDYALNRFQDFSEQQATASVDVFAGEIPRKESEETTHFSVIEENGNAVAFTTTINSGYGSGIVVEGAGFLLNNEMDDFSAKPGVPNQFGLVGAEANAVEPQKRMLSSMTPTIVVQDGHPILVTGSPGGSTIITTVLQVTLNVLEHQMSIADAVASPRFHHQWQPDSIVFEQDRFAPQTIQAVGELGHKTRNRRSIGDAHSAGWMSGRTMGASDPRSNGFAAGTDEKALETDEQ